MRGFLVLACVLLTACGAATTVAPTSAPPAAPTLDPTSPPTAVPTPAAAITAVATTPPTGAPTPAPDSPPATAASTPTTLVVDPAASHASYHAHEQLVGRTLPSETVGTTQAVSGSIALGPDGSILADQSQISVDLSQLRSDESRRDNFIKGNTLQTSRYPTASFVPRDTEGLPSPLPTEGQLTFQLSGDLTVHGVTRPVTWTVIAQFTPAGVSGSATTDVNISDFGMTPPKAGPVLSIQDGLTLEVAFSADRA